MSKSYPKPRRKKNFLQKIIARLNDLFNPDEEEEGGSGGQSIELAQQEKSSTTRQAEKNHDIGTDNPYVPLHDFLLQLVKELGGKKIPGKTSSLLGSLMPEDVTQFKSLLQQELKGSSVEQGLENNLNVTPQGKQPNNRKTPPRKPRPS